MNAVQPLPAHGLDQVPGKTLIKKTKLSTPQYTAHLKLMMEESSRQLLEEAPKALRALCGILPLH